MASTPSETYNGLRDLAFRTKASDVGFPEVRSIDAYGAVMEMALPNGTATLVAFHSGDASLYTSTGWCVIGAGRHEAVGTAAKDFVSCASAFVEKMQMTKDLNFPRSGVTRFYALTPAGTFGSSVLEDELVDKKSPFTRLYAAGHMLISAIRPSAG